MAGMPELRPLGKALGTEVLGVDLPRLNDEIFDGSAGHSPSTRSWYFVIRRLKRAISRPSAGALACRASMRSSSTGMPNIRWSLG